MSLPLHLLSDVPLADHASTVHDRLVGDPEEAVTAATADALAWMAGPASRWGTAPSELPQVVAGAAVDGPGAITVRWSGPESRTGWPALEARLLVVSQPAGGSRLVLASPRGPAGGLTTTRATFTHRRRAFHVALRRFLFHLGCRIGRPAAADASMLAATDAAVPRFVHHLRPAAVDPAVLTAALRSDLHALASRATQVALSRAADQLAAGRFRVPADPRVTCQLLGPGQVAVARIGWRGDEEATGWPALDLDIAVEAQGAGARVVALSPTEPRYDTSRNRVDRLQRDHLRRFAAADLVDAMCDEVVAVSSRHARGQADRTVRTTRQRDRART